MTFRKTYICYIFYVELMPYICFFNIIIEFNKDPTCAFIFEDIFICLVFSFFILIYEMKNSLVYFIPYPVVYFSIHIDFIK